MCLWMLSLSWLLIGTVLRTWGVCSIAFADVRFVDNAIYSRGWCFCRCLRRWGGEGQDDGPEAQTRCHHEESGSTQGLLTETSLQHQQQRVGGDKPKPWKWLQWEFSHSLMFYCCIYRILMSWCLCKADTNGKVCQCPFMSADLHSLLLTCVCCCVGAERLCGVWVWTSAPVCTEGSIVKRLRCGRSEAGSLSLPTTMRTDRQMLSSTSIQRWWDKKNMYSLISWSLGVT